MLGCQDYLVAMSLQQQQGAAPGPVSDLDLARRLQEEEYQQQQQQQQGPSQAPAQQVTNHTLSRHLLEGKMVPSLGFTSTV